MSVNDIYRVKFTQVYNLTGPQSVNVFHYEQVTAAGSATGSSDLKDLFVAVIKPAIEAIQSSIVSTLQVAAENVVPGTDNAYQNYVAGAEPGDISGDCLPPYDTWYYRYNRNSSAVKNGRKSFMGVPESSQSGGVAVISGTAERIALMNALGANLGVLGTTNTYRPVIYRREREEVVIPARTIPGMDSAVFDVAGVTFIGISTQNSRKFGRGI